MGDQAETTAKVPKVAIIGAGLTGLLAAQGLKKVFCVICLITCQQTLLVANIDF